MIVTEKQKHEIEDFFEGPFDMPANEMAITLQLNGVGCNVSLNGKPLPNRGPQRFEIVAEISELSKVVVHSIVKKDGEVLTSNGVLLTVAETYIPQKLTINGHTIWETK